MSLDHYIKLGVIGKGSYGEVWKVKHKKDRKQYVLKKLDLHNASKRERKAAEQEAKLLSRLKHPNIVSYKDSFEGGDGYLYIAMGYCEGGDLYARLKEQKGQPLEERQIVEWFVQIAMALQYMHERNILHRDLKTQNIFLTKSKIIKVGDLGIAKVLDSSSDMATTLIGTPYYMSPELFSNKPYNHKSDVWALGCCVYEMATLKHAFNAKDMNSLVYKILRGRSPQMPKMYSDELVSLIKAMMNHNTEKRPSVNRILRDPFIKRNIAVFLEGTKKTRRPSSSSGSRPGSSESRRQRINSIDDDQDDAQSVRSVSSNVSSASSVSALNREYRNHKVSAVEEKLEPLNDGPDLEPISEEQTPRELRGAGDARPSQGVPARHPTSQHRDPPVFKAPLVGEVAQAGIRKKKRRFLAEAAQQNQQVQQKPGLIKRESRNLPVPGERPVRPLGENANVKRQTDSLNVNSKPPRAESPNNNYNHVSPACQRNVSPRARSDGSPVSRLAGARSPSDKARSRSPRSKSTNITRSHSPKSSSGGSSSGSGGASGNKKSAIDNPRRVTKPRPLPATPRSSAEPPPESAEPQKSRSSRGAGRDRESGYGSSSSAANSRNDDIPEDTPRGSINKSARERRREQKERETPRTARSVDITPRNPPLLPASRPTTADNNRRPAARMTDPVQKSVDKIHKSSSYPTIEEKKATPSIAETPEVSKARPVRQPSLGGDEQSSSSNEEEENESEEIVQKKENKRNDKEMKNFISLLDTTLRMNKDDDKSDSDSDDDIVTPDQIAKPGSTTFIKRVKKKSPGSVGGGGDSSVAITPVPEEKTPEEEKPDNKSPINPNFNINDCLGLIPGGSPPGGAGKTMTTTGRLWERITMLRKDCIRGLGVERLKRAYDILDQYESDDLEPQLVSLLGKQDFDEFAGKIWQLKFCEEAAFGLI